MLSRILGLVRDLVITYIFGLGYQLSAYGIALTVPDMLFVLMSGGALGSALIPILTRLRDSGDEAAAQRLATGMLAVIGVSIALLTFVAWILAPLLVRDVVAPQAAARTQDLAIGLMRVVLFQPLFLSLAAVATAILQSHDQFTLPAFAPVAYNLSIIGGAVLLHGPLGMYGVAVGVVVGGFLFLAMQLPSVARLGLFRGIPSSFPAWPASVLADPNVWLTGKLMLPRIAGQAAVQANYVVAVSLASGLGQPQVGALRLANTLFVLPVGLFGTSIATVAFPTLSREAVDRDPGRFLYLLRRSIRGVLFFVLPASVGMILLREPIISLIYQHGRFDQSDTLLTARPLLYFCLAMWAFALVDILPRAFFALQDTRTPVKIAVGSVLLDIALSLLLVRLMGLGGLALAFALATTVQVFLLIRTLSGRIGDVLDRPTLMFFVKAVLACALMVFYLWLAIPLLAGYATMPLFLKAVSVGFTVGVGATVYLLTSVLLGQEEVGTLLRLAHR